MSAALHAHCIDIGHKISGVRTALIIFMVYGFPPQLPSSGPRYEGGYWMEHTGTSGDYPGLISPAAATGAMS